MKPSDNLYILIKSMTKGEKLFFKNFAKKHIRKEETNYIRLFDVINDLLKKGDLNEARLKEIFKSETLINNFSVAKAYLYESILKSLVAKDKDTLETLVNHSRILYSKNLLDLTLKTIEKAKQKARELDDKYALLNILNMEYNVLIRRGTKKPLESLAKVFSQEEKLIESILRKNRMRKNL